MAVDIGPKIGIDGEKQFRDSIQAINQQIKTLTSEMKATTSAFRDSADAEKKSEAQTKNLTEQIDAQKKKIDLLREGLQKSADKYGENDTRTLKWRQAVAEATATLNGMESQLDDTTGNVKDMGDEMGNAEGKATTFGDVLKANLASEAIVAGIKALKDNIKAAASALKDATLETAANADNIDKQSQKIGISREEYQKLSYALDKYGINVDILQGGMKKLSTQAQKGSDAFTQLGIAQEDVKRSSPSELFDRVVTALQSMEEGTERTTIATQLLGTSATELAPLLNDTSESFRRLKEDAPLMAGETVTAGAEMTDAMSNFKATMDTLKSTVVTNVMPAVTKALNEARKTLSKGESKKAIEKAGKALGTIVSKAVDLGSKILPVVAKILTSVVDNFGTWAVAIGSVVLAFKGFAIVKTLTSAINACKAAFAGLNAVMSANPIGAVLSAIGLLIGLITTFVLVTDDATESARELSEAEQEIVDASESATEAHKNAVESYKTNASVINGETDRTRKLWEELDSLTGANGRVKAADKERAEYILHELNEALGTEYELTGNQITRYKDLKESVDELIKSKQANNLLDVAKDKYDAAMSGKQAKEDNLALETQILNDLLAQRAQLLDENAGKIKTAMETFGVGYESARKYIETGTFDGSGTNVFNQQLEALDRKIEESRGYVESAQEELGVMLFDVEQYTKAEEQVIRGNYDNAIGILNAMNGYRWDAYDSSKRLSEKERNQLAHDIAEQKRRIDAYQDAVNKGIEGFTQELVDGEKRKLEKWQDLYSRAINRQYDNGQTMAQKFADGIASKNSYARQKTDDLINAVVVATDVGAQKANSKGREYVAEFSNGIKSGEETAKKAARETGIEIVKGLDVVDEAKRIGRFIAQGLTEGMMNERDAVRKKTDQLINDMLFGMRDTAGIASPSKVTAGYGRFIMQGLTVGMGAELRETISKTKDMMSKVLGTMDIGSYGNLAYAGGASSGNSYTTDMGGITLIVNGSNVQNVNELADLVSARLYDQVISAQSARR